MYSKTSFSIILCGCYSCYCHTVTFLKEALGNIENVEKLLKYQFRETDLEQNLVLKKVATVETDLLTQGPHFATAAIPIPMLLTNHVPY